jgi:hypothetical protein
VGLEPLQTRTNYFIGNDPAKWHTDIPNYARVVYQGVYPGIDLVYHGSNGQQVEYDFVVAPGADPGQIQWTVQGAKDVILDNQGNLVLTTSSGKQLDDHAPIIYQQSANSSPITHNSSLTNVAGHYVLAGPDRVSFQVGAYDQSRPLVIDPMLSYSTYLGGSSYDSATAITIDAAGSAYVTGWTSSADFPLQNPLQATYRNGDAFIAKFNQAGNALVYSTYLGGSSADGASAHRAD